MIKILTILAAITASTLVFTGCNSKSKEKQRTNAQKEAGLTSAQQVMVEMWERHTASEFEAKNVDATLATMTDEPYINNIPVMTGGVGREGVRHFYGTYFIPTLPADNEIILVSRTVGHDRIVDELVHKFTHSVEMPWILPGVPPTGKHVELAVVAIVEFKNGKIASEHIYWDQASLLVQLGLIKSDNPPVSGVETARKLLDPSLPSNELIQRIGGSK